VVWKKHHDLEVLNVMLCDFVAFENLIYVNEFAFVEEEHFAERQ